MSVPNEFLASTHSFHHENVAPLVIQAAHTNSNFVSVSGTNNVTHLSGGNFFPNSLGYDVTMLPFLHHTSQRSSHFAAPFVHQAKLSQTAEVLSKEEMSHLSSPVSRAASSFNAESAAVQSACWSRQSQLSPFGVLPHEISPADQVEGEKSPYENVLNAHHVAQSLNNLNQFPGMPHADKKLAQAIVSAKCKDLGLKKQPQPIYGQQKSMNDMKMFHSPEDISYRNGVINHGQTVAKPDQNKLINPNYKKMGNDLSGNEMSVNPVPRDYRVFKSEAALFSNTSAPVVKYSGKATKQYTQKEINAAAKANQASNTAAVTMMKNQCIVPGNSSPLLQQKISEFHREDSQSSPISLTSDDSSMSEQHRYSSPNSGIKDGNDTGMYHNLNSISASNNNTVCHANTGPVAASPVNSYREHHLQDMNCLGVGNKNKVTAQLLKLPHNVASAQQQRNGAIATEADHLSRKASFSPLYAAYNDQMNVAIPQTLPPQKQPEKTFERAETLQHAHSCNPPKMSGVQAAEGSSGMQLSKHSPNGAVGYSSVIMRTDQNYENAADKVEKSARQPSQPVSWSSTKPVKTNKLGGGYKNESNSLLHQQSSLPDPQHHLLMGLTERQHSYFDNTTPCPPPQQLMNSASIAALKCNALKNVPKTNNMYDGGGQQRTVEPTHQHMSPQSVDHQAQQQLHHYQQYMPVKLPPPTMSLNQSTLEPPPPEPVPKKTASRKRRSSKNMAQESYPQNHEPPPAHVNMYQQPTMMPPAGAYMMDSGSAEVTSRYDAPNQYYSQTGMHSYGNVGAANVIGGEHHQQHQAGITSQQMSPAALRSSPNTCATQRRPMAPQMHAGLPLTYFAPSQLPNHGTAQYGAALEYPVPTGSMSPSLPMQPYNGNQSCGEVQSQFSAANSLPPSAPEPQPADNESSRVTVPNVEEEFRFLFDPTLPHYKEIARPAEEEALYKQKSASKTPMFYRKNVDFLASYLKFLENNCESVETLCDSNSALMKNWNRSTKVVTQQQPAANKEAAKEEAKVSLTPPSAPKETAKPPAQAALVGKEPVKPVAAPPPVVKEPERNFENDPRYYPLPKSSDKRRLCDSSSEDESDMLTAKEDKSKSADGRGTTPTAKKAATVAAPAAEPEKKKVAPKKDIKSVKKSETKKESSHKDAAREPKKEGKVVKTKLEKLEKAKKKIEKLQKKKHPADKIKPKIEKAIAEVTAIKQSVVPQKKKQSADSSKDTQKAPPRRKVSNRKAKDETTSKIRIAMDSDNELLSSSDSDPSWTPNEEDEKNVKRRSSRIRSVKPKMKSFGKLNEQSMEHGLHSSLKAMKEMKDCLSESLKNSKISGEAAKFERFYVLKNQANIKHPTLWGRNGDKLQKFEHFEENGRNMFGSTSVTMKFSDFNVGKYQEVEAFVVEVQQDKLIVEICDETDIPTDFRIKENFMKESLCYESQFAVYIQTLVSQALDSNFLSEIAKENDVYFLSNMKVIDDVTSTYLADLTAVVHWGSSSIDVLVKTWPFVSIKNVKNDSSAAAKCVSCSKTNAKQTAIFYGQPYRRETLQGCDSNSIPNDLDKTVDLCSGCAREIKLFNRIWHQKYHVFVECAKYVSKKKGEDKGKCTTDVLNELLADNGWLSKLFYDIRNVWLQIWTVVQKMKGS